MAPLLTPIETSLKEKLIEFDKISVEEIENTIQLKGEGERDFLGDLLVEKGLISEDDLSWVLGQNHNLPVISLSRDDVDPKIANLLPPLVCRKYMVLPFLKIADGLSVVSYRPLAPETLEELAQMTDCQISLTLAKKSEIGKILNEIYGANEEEIKVGVDHEPISTLLLSSDEIHHFKQDVSGEKLWALLFSAIETLKPPLVQMAPMAQGSDIRFKMGGLSRSVMKLSAEWSKIIARHFEKNADLDEGVPVFLTYEKSIQGHHLEAERRLRVRVFRRQAFRGPSFTLYPLFTQADMATHECADVDFSRTVQILQNSQPGPVLVINHFGSSKSGPLSLLNELGAMNRSCMSLERIANLSFPQVEQLECMSSFKMGGLIESACDAQMDFVYFEGKSWNMISDFPMLTELAQQSVLICDFGDRNLSNLACCLVEQAAAKKHTSFINSISRIMVCFAANLLCPLCKVPDGVDPSGKDSLLRGAGCKNCFYFGVKGRKTYFEVYDLPKNSLINLGKSSSRGTPEIFGLEKKLTLMTESVKKKVLKDVLNGFLAREAIVDLSFLDYS